MIPILLLILLCLQVPVGKSAFHVYSLPVLDAVSFKYDNAVKAYKQGRELPPNLKGFKLKWNQKIKRDTEKGSISIYTPWYLKPHALQAYFCIILGIIVAYFSIGYPWGHLLNVPMAMGATFTSKADGGWDTEGQTTWNEAGHPVAGDTVTIANTHDITCESATACATLTIAAGGSLNTTAGGNWSLTITNACTLNGALTCNSSTVSCTGTGTATGYSVEGNGTFNGGSGTHTIGSLYITGGSGFTFSSGTTTINNIKAANSVSLALANSATFDDGNGTMVFAYAGACYLFSNSNTAQTFYNMTVNNASCALSYLASYSFALTVANNLTITAGSFTTWDGTTSANLTVTNATSITGTLDCKASTVSLGSGVNAGGFSVTINDGGTLTGGSGAHTYGCISVASGGTWTATSNTTTLDNKDAAATNSYYLWGGSTFTHSSGTVQVTYVGTCQSTEAILAGVTFNNFILNNGGTNAYSFVHGGRPHVIAGNLTITSGNMNTWSVQNNPITVTGTTSITGTLTPNASTVTFNGAVTVNNGGVLGGNTAWTCDCNATLTTNSGGTFSAPSAAGVWNQSAAFSFKSGGTFTTNSGTCNVDGNVILCNGSTTPITFYNVTFAVTGPALTTGAANNVTIQGTFTINNACSCYISYTTSALSLTMGTVSAAGTIVNNGTLTPMGGAATSITIQAASASYLCACTGTDWNWDGTASSAISVKWLDYQIDATTGGGGCTINFTGNMTIDAFTVSAGDTLSCTAAGTTITGAINKTIIIVGTIVSTGTSGNRITWTNLYYMNPTSATINWTYTDFIQGGSGATCVQFGSGTITYTAIDNCTFTSSATGLAAIGVFTNSTPVLTNCTFTGPVGGAAWNTMDILIYTGRAAQLSSCTFTTVGMQATSGWLVSKDASSNFTIYGILSSESAGTGYKAVSVTGNLTIKNADAYSTSFNTAYTLTGAMANVDTVALSANTTLTTGAYALTSSAGFVAPANSTFTITASGSATFNANSTLGGTLTVNGTLYMNGYDINDGSTYSGTIGGTGEVRAANSMDWSDVYFATLAASSSIAFVWVNPFYSSVGGGAFRRPPHLATGMDNAYWIDLDLYLDENFLSVERLQ